MSCMKCLVMRFGDEYLCERFVCDSKSNHRIVNQSKHGSFPMLPQLNHGLRSL